MCGEKTNLAHVVTGLHGDHINATQGYIILAACYLPLLSLPVIKAQIYSSY
jgi:hypothetical protein